MGDKMRDCDYLSRITKNFGPNNGWGKANPVGLAKNKTTRDPRALEEIDEEATRDYFVNLYRNCKD